MAVSIKTKTERGSAVEVSLAKAVDAADRGTINLRTWKGGEIEEGVKPHREEIYKLYDIVTNGDGSVTTCRADVPGSDPVVTISIAAHQITIDIKGTSFGIGDGTTAYEVTAEARQAIQKFLAESFPR